MMFTLSEIIIERKTQLATLQTESKYINYESIPEVFDKTSKAAKVISS